MNEFNAVSAEELTQVDGGWSIGGLLVAAVLSVPSPLLGAVATIVATETNAK